jgi:hypothetical protein
LYPGDSSFRTDILYTFKDGKIYQGNSDMLLDLLYTFKDGYLYDGQGATVFDIRLTIEGTPTVAELFAILLYLEKI